MAKNSAPAPTYMGEIRRFFTDDDKCCMKSMGIDLSTYQGVKFNALRIYFKVRDGEMPLGGKRWSKERVETFYQWMKAGYPLGKATPGRPAAARRTEERFRRPPAKREDAANLQGDQLEKLVEAIKGIMALPEDNPHSYFSLAGLHWLPKPDVYCRHHENAYNPWHRLYMIRFEDALRRVPGCEKVTLPYWDITAPKIPDFLFQPPFDAYTYPRDLYNLAGDKMASKGKPTSRYGAKRILRGLKRYDVTDIITGAMGQSHWEKFNGWDAGNTHDGIISAHDGGHNSCGPTMEYQDVAAFDPIFWFFHSNWDRLWWDWQRSFGATTLDAFKSHVTGPSDWLDDPLLNTLPPFDQTSAETINLANFDVSYGKPALDPVKPAPQRLLAASLPATETFTLAAPDRVSVRAKNINRLRIPGSFDVVLQARGKEVARRAIFQSSTPSHCATCRKLGLVNFDFEVPLAKLKGPLSISIVHRRNGREMTFPISQAGQPTINARLLLA